MKVKCRNLKILLPTDGSENSNHAISFAGRYGLSLQKDLEDIALLRVITGRYVVEHLPLFDFRAEILKQSDSFARFKQRHIEKTVLPALTEGEKILRDIGIKAPVEKITADGDPAQEIMRTACEGRYSTIIMARRGLSEIMGILLGSVTNKVVHSAAGQNVYITGTKPVEDKGCPVPRILVPVDGSKYSMKGVEHAACLVRGFEEHPEAVTFLRVVNISLYEKRLAEGIHPDEEAKKIVEKAKEMLPKRGVPAGLIHTKIRIGTPSEEIIKEALEGDYSLIIIGRKGRSALKDFILGGVSTTVIQRCHVPAIAVVSAR
jgi:nucleotide-binding universal stress UspA family protein